MDKVMNLTFASSLTDICEKNDSFDSGILRIAYADDNRNRSHIDREVFERCAATMYNKPIVANYDRETDTIGSHDVELVRYEDGSLRLVNVTEPVGVVPESAQWFWETVEEEDGTSRDYLCVPALLWKRQEAYRKIKKDGIVAQSMEITVRDGEKIDGVYYIYDFEFTAFALLGTAEPCFESAALELFELDGLKIQLSEMMQELKESYSLVSPSDEANNIHPQNHSTEGGEKVLQEKLDLAASYGIDVEALDFSMEELSIEELTEKFEAMKADAEVEPEAAEEENFELQSNMTDMIWRAMDAGEVLHRDWGDCPRYSYTDCDMEKNEIYAFDRMDWLLYGFSFAMDGDNIVVDWNSRKRMKYAIVEFNEGDVQESPFGAVYAEMEKKLADNAELEAKYQSASDTIASMETELGELRQFKADADNTALEQAREAVFAQFEDLIGTEAFEALKENCAEYSVEDLEEKCFAIRGRVAGTAKFSLEQKAPKIKVGEPEIVNEPYGGIMAKYGIGNN